MKFTKKWGCTHLYSFTIAPIIGISFNIPSVIELSRIISPASLKISKNPLSPITSTNEFSKL